MQRYRELLLKLGVYSILSFVFLMSVAKEQGNVQILYTDFYLFVFVLLTYISSIFQYKPDQLEIVKFKKLESYIVFKTKQFSRINVLITSWLLISNTMVMYIASIEIDYVLVCYYAINSFMLFEILYYICFLIQLILKKKWYLYMVMFAFLLMYMVEIMNVEKIAISFNIFSTYFYPSNVLYFAMNYGVWFILPTILYYNLKESIEL